MAERQGLFLNRHLSLAQSYALVILNYVDEIERTRNDVEALKRALATRADFDVRKMYPELFPAPEVSAEEVSDTGGIAPDDYKNVEWSSPKDAAEEWERLSSMLLQNHGALTGDEVIGAPSGDIEWTEWR